MLLSITCHLRARFPGGVSHLAETDAPAREANMQREKNHNPSVDQWSSLRLPPGIPNLWGSNGQIAGMYFMRHWDAEKYDLFPSETLLESELALYSQGSGLHDTHLNQDFQSSWASYQSAQSFAYTGPLVATSGGFWTGYGPNISYYVNTTGQEIRPDRWAHNQFSGCTTQESSAVASHPWTQSTTEGSLYNGLTTSGRMYSSLGTTVPSDPAPDRPRTPMIVTSDGREIPRVPSLPSACETRSRRSM